MTVVKQRSKPILRMYEVEEKGLPKRKIVVKAYNREQAKSLAMVYLEKMRQKEEDVIRDNNFEVKLYKD